MGRSLLFDNFIKPHIQNKDPFLIFRDGSSVSYQDFFSLSKKIAQLLRVNQISKGDRVLFQLEKSTYGIAVYTACIMTGAIFVPLNDQYTLEETKYFINDSKPKFIFCNNNRAKEIHKLNLKEDTSVYEIDPIDGFLKFNIDEYKEVEDIQTVNPDEIISFLYTSGTTGKSKAVALSHQNLYSNASSLKEYFRRDKIFY